MTEKKTISRKCIAAMDGVYSICTVYTHPDTRIGTFSIFIFFKVNFYKSIFCICRIIIILRLKYEGRKSCLNSYLKSCFFKKFNNSSNKRQISYKIKYNCFVYVKKGDPFLWSIKFKGCAHELAYLTFWG